METREQIRARYFEETGRKLQDTLDYVFYFNWLEEQLTQPKPEQAEGEESVHFIHPTASEERIGIDCSGQDIIPLKKELSVHCNRHPNTDGTNWGWIDGCTLNIVWSDNKSFNYDAAIKLVNDWNNPTTPTASEESESNREGEPCQGVENKQQPKPEQAEGEISVKEWYAKETNRTVEELDEYDLYICEVVCKYAALSSPAKMPGVGEVEGVLNKFGISYHKASDIKAIAEAIHSLFQKARMTEITEEDIKDHIRKNCRYPDGTCMMDEQAFYEGAKWAINKMKGG